MVTSIDTIIPRWFASVYDKTEDQSGIVNCILTLLPAGPLSVFEPGCGGGKIALPLSERGYTVTGMDMDEHMLSVAEKKAANFPRLSLLRKDMLVAPWPRDFDCVILAGNLMHNITTDWEYKQAQKQMILKSANSLKKSGLLFLDFDCPVSLSPFLEREREVLSGTDDEGRRGKMFIQGLEADDKIRLLKSRRRYEITLASGETLHSSEISVKHFLTLEETTAWLYRAGFTIEALYGSHTGDPFNEENRRCVILARKE